MNIGLCHAETLTRDGARKLLLQKHVQTDYTLYKLSKLESAASREVMSLTGIRDDEKRGGGISVEGTDPTAASARPITLADDNQQDPPTACPATSIFSRKACRLPSGL